MPNIIDNIEYCSSIASLIKQFIQEKRACGYQYDEAPKILKCFDQFLCDQTQREIALPEHLVRQWLEKLPKEQASTHQRRVGLIRQLARMMVRLGYTAYIVPIKFGTPKNNTFLPHVFTREEIGKLIHAADLIKPSTKTPWRHLVIPELLRLLSIATLMELLIAT